MKLQAVKNWQGRIGLLVVLWLCHGSGMAQTGLRIQLVAETQAIVPGETFRVGLFIQHDKGWHTYWQQPGIVGVPTTITWELPPGFKAGPLEYPEPEATMMFQIKAQGYERDVLLQTQITAPTDLPTGGSITIRGKAAWMCCGNSCHPDSRILQIRLPVALQAQPDARWQPVFAKERAAYAKGSTAWLASALEEGKMVTLTLRPISALARPLPTGQATPPVLFFTEDGWINSDAEQTCQLMPDGSLKLTLTRAEVFLGKGVPNKLLGILQREGGWHTDGSLRSMIISPKLDR